jgi:tetratricopeptide (TPR) repeat protein
LLILLGLSSMSTRAQTGVDSVGTGGTHRIQGRIYFPSGRRSDATAVKVSLESSSSERTFVVADQNGSFLFNNLATGSYRLTIDAGPDYELATESVLIEGTGSVGRNTTGADVSRTNVPRTFSVMINLLPKRAITSKPAVINAALAAIPKPAVAAYQRAIEIAKAGDAKQAVNQLKLALSLYPEFPLALNELGVQYLKLGEAQKAVEALSSAVRLQPEDFTPRLNYGIALLESRNIAEAETQLRHALNKNGNSWMAHMYLGIALIGLQRFGEAEQELLQSVKIGGPKLGLPHYYLGGLYWRAGDRERAIASLEKYLEVTPTAPNAERVRTTIRELRSK